MTHTPSEKGGMNEWQDIATAPKDGQFIIAASDEWGVCIVNYIAGDWYSDGSCHGDETPLDDLTHWMPLPPPPRQEGDG